MQFPSTRHYRELKTDACLIVASGTSFDDERHLPEMKRGGVNSLRHRKYQSLNGAQFARRYPMVKVFPTRLKCFPICAE